MTLSTSEQLTHNSIRIECQLRDGNVATGTGFFFDFYLNGSIPCIVTNKHVVEDAEYGIIRLNLADSTGQPTGNYETCRIHNFEARCLKHPDPEVDLCIILIAEILNEIEQNGRIISTVTLDKSIIPTAEESKELTAFEEIIMIGYPNGIWDSVNNKPIVRRGITATHPNLPYEGNQEFVIDAACFPGSSGSPVFLYNIGGGHPTASGTFVFDHRIKLLGILYAGHEQLITGEIQTVKIPTQHKKVAYSSIPINLGVVINSKKLLDFEQILESIIASQPKNYNP